MPNLQEIRNVPRREPGVRKQNFCVSLPPDDLATVHRLAEQRSVSTATVLREAVRSYLQGERS